MKLVARLGAWGVVVVVGLGFAACSSEVEGTSTSTGAGGDDGAGGQGSATASTAVSSSSSGSGSGGSPFIECPEPVTNFDTGECDILNPECPPGKACYPVQPVGGGKLTTKCVPWSGVKGPGAACTSNDECAAGLFCAFYCSPPCCHTAGLSDCDCNISGSGFIDPSATIWMCNYLPSCTLFVADTCMDHPGSQCHLQNINENLATCAPPSLQQTAPTEGKPCKFINDCTAMQMCQNSICRYNCLLDSFMTLAVEEGGCPDGQTCQILKQGNNTGVCNP